MNVFLFNTLLAGAALLSIIKGGVPERLAAASLVTGAIATLLSYSALTDRFYSVEYGVMAIDIVLLAALVAIALYANRFWPLALAALQFASVLAHVAKLIDVSMGPWSYAFLLKAWAYPMLLSLVVGTVRHQVRLKRFGVDRPWSPQ